MKRKLLIIIPVIVILFISVILGVICYDETKKVSAYLSGDIYSSVLDQVNSQYEVNRNLMEVANNKKYTFDKAYVELNPYKISPLSAIIIFQTSKSEEIDVYINGVFVTKMEETKKHTIPIMGLYEDYENIIKLVMGDKEKEYIIKTDKSDIEYPLNVTYKSEKLNSEELYFTVASYATYLTGWDIEGKLRFYLTLDNRMDVEWLENGHFLIGTSQGQFAENFVSFVEMDYLGKIYNYYTMENGVSFEMQNLSNGNYMIAGGKKAVYITEQVVYEMNPNDGSIVNTINLSNIVKEIDPNFDSVYLGQKAIRNAFYYDEANDNLIMSFRGWDAVLSFSFKNKKLNWVFTDPNNELFKNDVWESYLINCKKGRYPLGQHSVIITSEGNIGFFNNGYNRLHGFENGGNDLVSYYKNNYSSAEIYKIENMSATLVWTYDNNKKYFSHQYGSIRELNNNNILIDFGYNLKEDYRKSKIGKLSEAEQSPDNIYSTIIEVDRDNNIIFSATSEEGKYRAFKHSLYNEITANTDVSMLRTFNTIESDELIVSNHKEYNLDDASEWIYSLEFTENTFNTNYGIMENDSIDLYFVNKTGKIYIMNYKNKNVSQLNRIFNIDLPNGDYALYINLNGVIYKTNHIYKF